MVATAQAVTVSDASRRSYYALQEATWGVTPTAAATTKWMVSESLKQNTQAQASQRIRGDRQTDEWVRFNVDAGGDVVDHWSYGEHDDYLSALLGAEWATNVLQNGTIFKSFSLSVMEGNIAGAGKGFVGMAVAQMRRRIAVGQFNEVTWTFLGKTEASIAAVLGGSTAAASTTQVMNPIDHVSAITEGGVADTLYFTDLELTVNANLRPQPAVGYLGPIGVGMGTFDITGRMTAYLQNVSLMDKYLNWTDSDFGWTETDDAGNAYTWLIPEIKFTDGQRLTQGRDTDVFAEMTFGAQIDAEGTGKMIQVTRAPAV